MPKPGTTIEEWGFIQFDTGKDQGVVHAKILKITIGTRVVWQGYEVLPDAADQPIDDFTRIDRCNYRVTIPDVATLEIITDGKKK